MSVYIEFCNEAKDVIKGEVKQKGYENHVELESVTFAMEKPGEGLTGSARRRGDVKFNDISITKFFDSSSAGFCKNISGGKVFSCLKIKFTASFTDNVDTSKSTQIVYLELELNDVQVTNYSLSGDGEETPKEEISLNYEKITSRYTPKTKKGDTGTGETWGYTIDTGEAF